ncbi:MAG: transposase [Parcubacteria group bacterium]|nr:transposase [Parcubacteria group bacterium]
MTLFKNKYRIESTRLPNYNYSSDGAYFVTICTKNKQHFFGEIMNGKLSNTKQTEIAKKCWFDLPNHYSNCVLDKFIIMPNHVHGVIFIDNGVGGIDTSGVETGLKPVSTNNVNHIKHNQINNQYTKHYSLSEIIRGFKTFTARRINEMQNASGQPFWQPRFYEHIIRNDRTLNKIRQYIIDNPANWQDDRNNRKY